MFYNHLWDLCFDADGTLWIATQTGLSYLPPDGEEILRFSLPEQPDLLRQVSVNALAVDQAGNLWAGLEGALIRIAPDRKSAQVMRPLGKGEPGQNRVRSLLVSQEGNIWAGTYGGGAFLVEAGSGEVRVFRHDPADRFSLSSNQITQIFQDRSGVIWLGTSTAGLNRYNPATRLFGHYRHRNDDPHSLSDNTVWAFGHDGAGVLWVGTENGLNRLDPATGRFTRFRHDPDDPDSLATSFVGALYGDSQGRLWVGTLNGLDLWLPERRAFRHHRFAPDSEYALRANNITLIREDSRGRFWVGTAGGLFRFDPESGEYRRYGADPGNGLPAELVLSMVERPDGRFWIATEGGLSLFDPEQETFRNFDDGTEALRLPSRYVHYVHLAEDALLWIGTSGGLLAYDERTGRLRRYDTGTGLPNNTIYCILPGGDGSLWLSTNNGLVRFRPTDGLMSVYGPVDGLQSREFNTASCARGPDGMLYFGGINGFNSFDPEAVSNLGRSMPTIITDFQRLGLEVSHFGARFTPDSTIRLDYDTPGVTIEYALLDYAAPERNRFEHRLEGFDEGWVSSGTRNHTTYTNLDAGEYVFRVRGISAAGIPSSREGILNIIVEPAPWATWWAYTAYVAAGLLLAWAFIGAQLRRQAREHALLAEQQQRRWAETLHQLSQALAASLDARTVASQLADHLARLVNFNIAALFVEQGADIVLAGSRGLTGQQERLLEQLPEQGARLLAEFRHVRKSVRFDSSYLPVRPFVEETPHIRQYLAVPLVSRSEELTLLLLGRSEEPFSDHDVEVASAFARQALHALDNARLFAEVQNLGTTDSLTRVHNRRFFFEQAELEFSRSRRYKRDLALLLLDADHFRDVNEYYGQDVGDRVMKLIASTARQNLRHFDIIGRYSGESFIVLLPETDLNVAADIADRLRKCVEDLRIETHRGELRVTVSIGVAVNRNGESFEDLSSLINRADMALYEAKRAGRNRVITG